MQDCSGANLDANDVIVLHDMLPSEIGTAIGVPEPYIVVSEIEQPPEVAVPVFTRVVPDNEGTDSDSDDDVVGPDAEDLDIMEAFKKANCSAAIKQAMMAVIDARRKESMARKKTTAALEQLASLVFEGSNADAESA